MKIKLLSILIALGLTFSFTACDDDTDIIALASMSATIDGSAWSSTPAAVVGTTYSDYTTIVGYNLDGQYMLISIRGTSAGTYEFGGSELSTETYAVYMEDKEAAESELDKKKYLTVSGQVVITSVEGGKINGTFSFTAKNDLETSIEITNGKFSNVPLINSSGQ